MACREDTKDLIGECWPHRLNIGEIQHDLLKPRQPLQEAFRLRPGDERVSPTFKSLHRNCRLAEIQLIGSTVVKHFREAVVCDRPHVLGQELNDWRRQLPPDNVLAVGFRLYFTHNVNCREGISGAAILPSNEDLLSLEQLTGGVEDGLPGDTKVLSCEGDEVLRVLGYIALAGIVGLLDDVTSEAFVYQP